MTSRAGLGATLGLGAEATFGTYEAPSRWLQFLSESLKYVPKITQGKALMGGQLAPQSAQRVVTTSMVEGDIKTYAFVNGLGLIFEKFFGVSTIAVQGTTAAYLQTHTFGDNTGQSLSVQVGIPTTGGVIVPYTYTGVKISELELTVGVDEIAELTVNTVGQQLILSEAYASPTFTANEGVLSFAGGIIKAGNVGSEAAIASVSKATLNLKRPYDTSRFFLGSGLMDEPITNNFLDLTGTLETEFQNTTDWESAFNTQAPLSLILELSGALIAAGYPQFLDLALPNIYLSGNTPDVSGPDVVKPSYKFEGYYNGTNAPCTLTYQSTDTAF
ncbi:MAG: phage tail tube protein [Ferrimicrobium sp.]